VCVCVCVCVCVRVWCVCCVCVFCVCVCMCLCVWHLQLRTIEVERESVCACVLRVCCVCALCVCVCVFIIDSYKFIIYSYKSWNLSHVTYNWYMSHMFCWKCDEARTKIANAAYIWVMRRIHTYIHESFDVQKRRVTYRCSYHVHTGGNTWQGTSKNLIFANLTSNENEI